MKQNENIDTHIQTINAELELGSVSPTTGLTISKQLPHHNASEDQKLFDIDLHRKLKEQQNKMKRNLLQQAISKCAEKTEAEAKKLNEIKHSLDLLDTELATDVSILRKKIEAASIHFHNIEKHYTAIEKRFLKAKLDLFKAHEKKNLLTEHLYKIIEHNEDRKAAQLTELMEKVGLSLDSE